MSLSVIVFLVLFLLTSGLAAFGIMSAISLNKNLKGPAWQSLIYQQIFVFTFLTYGIWGNVLAGELLKSFQVNIDILKIVSFFIPFLDLPFLIISWFMFTKFIFNLSERKINKYFSISYFITFSLMLLVLTFLIREKGIDISNMPEVKITRIVVVLNLLVHLVILILWETIIIKSNIFTRFNRLKYWFLYIFTGVLLYSIGFWFIYDFHFIIQSLVILFTFAILSSVPVYFSFLNFRSNEVKQLLEPVSFEKFYSKYDISRREAEIIREICSGKSNQEIADKLFITLQTVKDHIHRIYTKTGVGNRVQLINLVNKFNPVQ